MFGIDATSSGNPAALKKAGVKFVCRYLSPTAWKNLTPAEAKQLRAARIGLVTVYESTGKTVRQGSAAGVSDARVAARGLVAVGAPKNAPVYFAVDYDAPASDQPQINAYLAGAASVLGHNRVGIYAGYGPCARALDAKACRFAWQTYAWSGGKWDRRAHLRQYKNAQKLAGLDVDFDVAMKGNFGQWQPPRVPRPKLRPKYMVIVYKAKSAPVKRFTTRFVGLSLVKYDVGRRKPDRIDISRVP